jgi:indolepyruvate ferredoxin oxidoreductase beta subunit
MARADPITILVCALGGEGGGVLAEWLYDAAVHAGHPAQSTSIPGVAQRTGATTYYIEVCPLPERETGGVRPVFSLNPVPGAIDLLVSSELLETARQVGQGFASADRTVVVSSTARALTVGEKMALGDGRHDAGTLLAAIQRHARSCELLDMAALARASGTVLSAVLLGAIAASGVLPLDRAAFEAAIRRGGKGVDASLRGFAAAFDAVAARQAQRAQAEALVANALPLPAALPEAAKSRLPAAVHDLAALGHARLVDYQDPAYAALYVDRLAAVAAAERAADPGGERGWALTRETARWLALWMAFDDIVRVAALKASAARIARVRREVAAAPDEIVKVFDHFKPGVPEVAALLPARLARRLAAWDERRRARGAEPWSMPVRVGAHTVLGTLALRALAGLKRQRRRGSRFAAEQELIEQWLAALREAAAQSWALGLEVARCGRLIKGYGSTNERGKASLLHIVAQVAPARSQAEAARKVDAVRAAREAALADDAGRAFDQALKAHGAPPRPLRAQPIRWYRRRPDTPAPGVVQRS